MVHIFFFVHLICLCLCDSIVFRIGWDLQESTKHKHNNKMNLSFDIIVRKYIQQTIKKT